MNWFDDPRHRESESLAHQADQMKLQALHCYKQAAIAEESLAREVPSDQPRIKGVLAISAVALWYKAEEWAKVIQLGNFFVNDWGQAHIGQLTVQSEILDMMHKARKKSGVLVTRSVRPEISFEDE